MDIVHVYRKKRREFGRHCDFEASECEIIIDKKPEEEIATQYILQNPFPMAVQCVPDMNEHKVI